jgi:hypothetical protein
MHTQQMLAAENGNRVLVKSVFDGVCTCADSLMRKRKSIHNMIRSNKQRDDSAGIVFRSIPAAAPLSKSPYVRTTAFRSGLLNFRICLAANEDSCAREV